MNVVIAIDSLKGSLSSMEAGIAIADGIKKVDSFDTVTIRPLADGGEGTVDALVEGMQGKKIEVIVTGPLGEKVSCSYGILEGSKTAIIEMAGAAGITLISEFDRNPLNATTYGVGEVIKDAIARGCRNFIVGIGGSATNDGGVGMLQALGFGFLNKNGDQISLGAKGLQQLDNITFDQVIPELKECVFKVACDVTNPLCGEQGCSNIFGPQKGATPSMIKDMDNWLSAYADIAQKICKKGDREYPGTGAAGGLGFAFLTFLNATLKSGIQIIIEETNLEKYIEKADIVITGEGRLDEQTAMGKAPIGVAKLAKKYDLPVIAFSGCVTEDAVLCNEKGIDAFFPILRTVISLEQAMKKETARKNIMDSVIQVFRLIKKIQGKDINI